MTEDKDELTAEAGPEVVTLFPRAGTLHFLRDGPKVTVFGQNALGYNVDL